MVAIVPNLNRVPPSVDLGTMETPDIALLVFGLALLASPFETVSYLRARQNRSAMVEGTVIDHESHSSVMHRGDATQHGPGSFHARIAYEVDGVRYECVSSVGASWILHPIGLVVDVVYDPQNPADADIRTGAGVALLERAVVFGLPVAGVVCLGILASRMLG